MKLTIDKSPKYNETEVLIKCREIDSHLQEIIDLIKKEKGIMAVSQQGDKKLLRLSSVYYIESVDEKTFVYCKDEVYSTGIKLYEAEELLKDTSFVRISKACILNIDVLDSVKVMLNGKMETTLDNGEKLVVNRHYVPGFKKKFGL